MIGLFVSKTEADEFHPDTCQFPVHRTRRVDGREVDDGFRVCGAPGYFDVATQLMEKDREGRYMLSHTSHYCEEHGRKVIDSLLNLLHADEDEQEES